MPSPSAVRRCATIVGNSGAPTHRQIPNFGQIGRSGQGTVYRARGTGLDHIVAIKVIDQFVADDAGYLGALRSTFWLTG